MKKVLVFGRDKERAEKLVTQAGFIVDEKEFDFVVSYGGDGTFMQAEHRYPGVPKILLRNSVICKLCSSIPNEDLLERIMNNHYLLEEFWKIEGSAKGRTVTAMNDLVLHNADPRHAIRYQLTINDRKIGETIVGDGVVVASPLGSTGYYRSITDSFFEVGIGLAFNNSTEQSDHMVLKEESDIKIVITRGPAFLYADNQDVHIELDDHDEIRIKKSDKVMKLVRVT